MTRRPRALVLDSWAVLAYLGDEGAGGAVADLIADAHDHATPVSMTIVNAGEVWYILAREVSEAEADRAVESLRHLGVALIDIDWKLARQAGLYKSKGRMSYADCFAAALARLQRAELVTGDREFRQVEGEVRVRWLE